MTLDLNDRLTVFHGEANPAVARVYARLSLINDELPSAGPLHLSGRLVGPNCAFAQTLPLRMPFFEIGGERQELVAEAVAPDPCFWTPELPFLYRAQIELRGGDEVLSKVDRTIGLRRFGVRGSSLLFEGKRFVMRGAIHDELGDDDGGFLSESDEQFARQSWTAIVFNSPSDSICETASRRGVIIVADLTRPSPNFDKRQLNTELRRLSQWPAVAIAVLPAGAGIETARRVAPNLLLAQRIGIDQPIKLQSWANVAFADVREPRTFVQKVADCDAPIIAVRSLNESQSMEEARAGCDELQHDLSIAGDFAGYVV